MKHQVSTVDNSYSAVFCVPFYLVLPPHSPSLIRISLHDAGFTMNMQHGFIHAGFTMNMQHGFIHSNRWFSLLAGFLKRHQLRINGHSSWSTLLRSLRSWLCGGEIVSLSNAFVAHMWRRTWGPGCPAGGGGIDGQ